MKQKKEYDMAILSKALTGLGLRVILAGYLIYLAWKVLKGTLAGGPIPLWGGWLVFAVFACSGVVFCVFSVRQYLIARKEATLRENNDTYTVKKNETDGTDD